MKTPFATEVDLGPGHIVLNGAQLSPKKGTAPNFRPMSIVAKRSPILATAEHLYNQLATPAQLYTRLNGRTSV